MSNNQILIQNISFRYPSQTHFLFQEISLALTNGWTGIIGHNGSGKTTLLKLAARMLVPESGFIHTGGSVYYCAQVTDDKPGDLTLLLNDWSVKAGRLISMLNIGDDWVDRWPTLSFGERKRAQIAAALFQEPDILAMDEPSNHLDRDATVRILDALKHYRGCGLIVSHNRHLLNELCQSCVFIEKQKVWLKRGNYDHCRYAFREEKKTLKRKRENEKRKLDQLKKELKKRKHKASQADNKKSKRGIDQKDHDAKSKINLAKLTGRDAVAGKLTRQLSGRLNQAQKKISEIDYEKEYTHGIWLPDSVSKRDVIVSMDGGELAVSETRKIKYDSFAVRPCDKIGLTGKNGTGKTSFLRFLKREMNDMAGWLLYIPQEISLEKGNEIRSMVTKMPHEQLARVMTLVRRLGSDPERLFDKDSGSPGEIKKIMLAMGILEKKQVLLLDEPVNHLDLISVESLERALIQYPGCLITISHDLDFIRSVTSVRWTMTEIKDGPLTISHLIRE